MFYILKYVMSIASLTTTNDSDGQAVITAECMYISINTTQEFTFILNLLRVMTGCIKREIMEANGVIHSTKYTLYWICDRNKNCSTSQLLTQTYTPRAILKVYM
jgi:hypothetical protein